MVHSKGVADVGDVGSQIARSFGRRVRRLRRARGWTQDRLSAETGLHRTYISRLERGEQNVTLVSVGKLGVAFDLPLSTLFDGVEP